LLAVEDAGAQQLSATDLAVWRNDGSWWVLNGITGSTSGMFWGMSGDIPTPADFDGDSRYDFCVYRPSNQTWYIVLSSSGAFQYYVLGAKCSRHFIERSNQDAKSELGWDELRAQNYLAWEHHLALTVLASWFIAQTQREWRIENPRCESLNQEFETEDLPRLSMANVRELLRAAMPLPQLSKEEATNLVVRHLVNRARSRKSRIKHSVF
jgi:hypothetical protein